LELDNGTIPLLGVNSDPISVRDAESVRTKRDERRSHGALCMCTSQDMHEKLPMILYGGGKLNPMRRIQCIVKSAFSETRVVPALNDLLICNPSPAAVSRFRMGWLSPATASNNYSENKYIDSNVRTVNEFMNNHRNHIPSSNFDHNHNSSLRMSNSKNNSPDKARLFPSSFSENGLRSSPIPKLTSESSQPYGTITRFGGQAFDVIQSINVWSSGMWISTPTGSTAAMHAAGGQPMDLESEDLQYLIREHMIEDVCEKDATAHIQNMNNQMLRKDEQLYIRWNSHKGRIYIDGSHLTHDLELGDEILINNKAPTVDLFINEN